jgi:uncharacterized 2Fe-2S/4Fe-4S cluster protein (DUF4445 family)
MLLELELDEQTLEIAVEPADAGRPLTEILRHARLPLNTRCGERALCRSCLVEIQRDGDWVSEQACRIVVDGDLRLRIPPTSILAYAPQVLSDYRVNVPTAHDPLFGGSGVAAAVDIGTTTVALSLVDLEMGNVVARSAGFNRQMDLGDDVLTRINRCMTDPSALKRLQGAIVQRTIAPLLDEALSAAGRESGELRGFVLAGNTTMLHLVSGVDPSPLGVAPFTPAFIGHVELQSRSLGLRPNVPVHLLPGAAAYVGADITGGVFASGLVYDDGPALLVDVGTNGEIVLKADRRMLGCATAAGPAFEGSGLTCGIRAGDGAISHLAITGDPLDFASELIGTEGSKPIGICGSAYVDFLAEAVRSGLIGYTGRFQAAGFPHLAERFNRGEYGLELEVCKGLGKRPIVVSEPDIARLLQAKAAIAAGIVTLLRRAGLTQSDVRTLYLAGGFGMHLDIGNAIACGLFPGFDKQQIELVGNTSLAGAVLSTLDASVLPELARIGNEIEIVELNLEPGFEDTYIEELEVGRWVGG